MLPDELERAAERHVPGAGAPLIALLSHGVVNDTYRVRRSGVEYAMRVPASAPSDPKLDRTWEARVLESAAAAGLAPRVEYCDPQGGVLISRWVVGRQWSPAEARRRSGILRMAGLLRRIHALPMPAPARLMNAGRWIERYSAAARRGAAPNGDILRAAAEARLAALAAPGSADPVVCHSDLHLLNLIDCGEALVLLDWEYAHAAEPFWDLAGWSANNDFGEELRHELLAAYQGRRPAPSEQGRLNLLTWLYDYVCLLWCELHGPARDGVAARSRQLAARLMASK
jgi:thiamine kinase